ncbi:MAG: hypothetical protein ACPG7E_05440 [Marinirhabdus sp.]
MKTLSKYLLVTFLSLALFSCKSDDEGNVEFDLSNTNIAGTYDMTMLTYSATGSVEVNGVPVETSIEGVGDTFQIDFVFNDNGTYAATGEYRGTTVVTSGGNSETDTEIIIMNDTGTYAIAGDAMLTLTPAGDEQSIYASTYTVTRFTQTEIYLTVDETVPPEDNFGIDHIQSEIRFKRK